MGKFRESKTAVNLHTSFAAEAQARTRELEQVTEFQASIAFLIIIAVLTIRPDGLLGKREVTKV